MKIGRIKIETKGKIYGGFVAASIITNPKREMLWLKLKESGLLTILTETMAPADRKNFKEVLLRGIKEELGIERCEVLNVRSLKQDIRSKNAESELKGFELFSCELTQKGADLARWLANEGVEEIVWLGEDQVSDSDLDSLARDTLQLYKQQPLLSQERDENARENEEEETGDHPKWS